MGLRGVKRVFMWEGSLWGVKIQAVKKGFWTVGGLHMESEPGKDEKDPPVHSSKKERDEPVTSLHGIK